MNSQLASNSASALISTINSSPAVVTNPYVYSQNSNIDTQTSVQVLKVSPQSGSTTANSTLHFQVPKNGLLSKIVLKIPYTWTSSLVTGTAVTTSLRPNGLISTINEIVLSSQGRTLCRLTNDTIKSVLSVRPSYNLKGMEEAYGMNREVGVVSDTLKFPDGVVAFSATNNTLVRDCYLNLDFPLMSQQLAIDTLFVQNIRISISMGSLSDCILYNSDGTTEPIATNYLTYSEPSLFMEFRNQDMASSDALTNSNFSSGLLTQIMTNTYENEPTLYQAMVAGTNKMSIQLKNSSCISGFYVFISTDYNDDTSVLGTEGGFAKKIKNIKFSSNGQSWVDCDANLVGYFSLKNQDGLNGYDSVPQQDGSDKSPSSYIYYINMASSGINSNKLSNLLSLRELSNPTVEVEFYNPITTVTLGQTDKIGMRIVYNTAQLSSIVSSSGQYNISLSN